jgi:hypothetical protein
MLTSPALVALSPLLMATAPEVPTVESAVAIETNPPVMSSSEIRVLTFTDPPDTAAAPCTPELMDAEPPIPAATEISPAASEPAPVVI